MKITFDMEPEEMNAIMNAVIATAKRDVEIRQIEANKNSNKDQLNITGTELREARKVINDIVMTTIKK